MGENQLGNGPETRICAVAVGVLDAQERDGRKGDKWSHARKQNSCRTQERPGAGRRRYHRLYLSAIAVDCTSPWRSRSKPLACYAQDTDPMTTFRQKRNRTTKSEVPRAKRGSSAPPAPEATTIENMRAVSPTPPETEAITQPNLKRRNKPAAMLASVAPTVDAPPASLNPQIPDPVAARYSVIPRGPRMEARFATLEQYTEALPRGLESYPAVRTKGAIVRRLLLDPVHSLPLGVGLPRRLEDLIRTPPSVNDWVPLVDLCALHAAVFDHVFANEGGVPAYEEWTFQRNLQLLTGPQYRSLIAVKRPERLLVNHAGRWSAFHRGSSLHVTAVAEGNFKLRLSYPPYSWPKMSRVALSAAFRAAVVIAGAKSAEVTSEEESVSLSSFDIRWLG